VSGSRSVATSRLAGDAYLVIENLSKRFGSFTALRDINLEVRRGEFVCFLGPSGCGKTTLLRAIAGLDFQSEGRIFQDGVDISDLPPGLRDFGIVFQSYALFPNLTVGSNVAYGLESQRAGSRREIARRVEELLNLVGLPDAAAKYPRQLSGGQQQRVALARALATSPGLLLLDEPLSALDARVRQRLREEIKMLQRRLGITTIMVTHDQEEALAMADRIVVMDHGVIEQIGTPLEIYSAPANVFVADFVGSMNRIHGVVTGHREVEVAGRRLRANAMTDGLQPGQGVCLCLRPEDVLVRGADAAEANAFDMYVDALEFLGSFFRSRLKGGGAHQLELIADFSANAVRDLRIAAGSAIRVALPVERLRFYPQEVR
jgi:iron(III) transport system ATP-binding protein